MADENSDVTGIVDAAVGYETDEGDEGSQLCVDAYSFVFVLALDFSLLQFIIEHN